MTPLRLGLAGRVARRGLDFGRRAEGKEAFLSDQADKILTEALKLTTSDRARVAAELIASVDGEPDTDAEAAWASEIDRRVRRIRSEGPRGDDWQDVHARIASKLRSK